MVLTVKTPDYTPHRITLVSFWNSERPELGCSVRLEAGLSALQGLPVHLWVVWVGSIGLLRTVELRTRSSVFVASAQGKKVTLFRVSVRIGIGVGVFWRDR